MYMGLSSLREIQRITVTHLGACAESGLMSEAQFLKCVRSRQSCSSAGNVTAGGAAAGLCDVSVSARLSIGLKHACSDRSDGMNAHIWRTCTRQ